PGLPGGRLAAQRKLLRPGSEADDGTVRAHRFRHVRRRRPARLWGRPLATLSGAGDLDPLGGSGAAPLGRGNGRAMAITLPAAPLPRELVSAFVALAGGRRLPRPDTVPGGAASHGDRGRHNALARPAGRLAEPFAGCAADPVRRGGIRRRPGPTRLRRR